MLTNPEQKQIRQLLQTPQWAVAEQLANKMVDKFKDEQIVHSTEWETLRASILREGKIEGVRALVQEIYRQAQEAAK